MVDRFKVFRQEVVQESYKLHLGLAKEENSVDSRQSPQVVDSRDLRRLVQVGKEKGLSAYQVLLEAGVIVADFALNAGSDAG